MSVVTADLHNIATQWECQHEQIALLACTPKLKSSHENVSIEKCGLFINSKYPHLGASPDAIIKCDRFDKGGVEVK